MTTNLFRKVALEEDTYVEALEAIIERDFFPESSILKKTLQSDADLIDEENVSTCIKSHSSWNQTEKLENVNDNEYFHQARDSGSNEITSMTLDKFTATHTSEDNSAFDELQTKAIQEHRSRYHWAFDSENQNTCKMFLLSDGTWTKAQERNAIMQACAPKGDAIDKRPKAPDTWQYRSQNPLIFPPLLEVTRNICRVGESRSKSEKMLQLEDKCNMQSKQSVGPKKKIVYENSRFPPEKEVASTSSGFEKNYRKEYDLIEMTPTVAPGIDASPFMTWGSIEGTPINLNVQGHDGDLDGPTFRLKEISSRERIADTIGLKKRKRKPSSRYQTPMQTPQTGSFSATPMSIREGMTSNHRSQTPQRSRQQRLSDLRFKKAQGGLGMHSELRASYSTPQIPPRRKIPR